MRVRPPVEVRDTWRTPEMVTSYVLDRWCISRDIAATGADAIVSQSTPEEVDALDPDYRWGSPGEVVWVNPPFSQIPEWISKAEGESRHGVESVFILPANRCDREWFARLVDVCREVIMLRPRVKYIPPVGIPASTPMYGSMLAHIIGAGGSSPIVTAVDLRIHRPKPCRVGFVFPRWGELHGGR